MATRSKELVPVDAESSLQKVAAQGVSKLVTLASPWVVGLLLFGVGAAFHFILDTDDPAVASWTAFLMSVGVIVLTGVTYGQSHARGPWGKTHTTATTLLTGLWVTAATINGPTTVVTGRIALIGGFTLCATWNIRTVIRMKGWDAPGAISDPLAFLFGQGAERAGLTVEARTTEATEHKVEGAVQLEAGRQTAEDLQKKVPYIESGIGLPPGSITTSIDPDDASKAKVVVSDPRVMKHPIPWPGPSRPGGSIADPLRHGLWQDLDEVAYVIAGHHLQIMGQTGSGKSIGGAWNLLGEIVTRYDAAVFAIDITKGEQTLGPLSEALHRFETTKAGAKQLLRDVQARVKERTDALAAKQLQKWKPGCGLTYWIVWIEEFPDVYDALTDKEQEAYLSMLKAIRSAGGTVVMSLQRSDYTQMPTLARGQLAKACFGVESAHDAGFGLSEAQQDAGARPELWSNKQPGMTYWDAPSIPDERIAMPMRTFAWGLDAAGRFDDERANAAMREHAAAWPAAAKPVDEGTAAISRLPSGGRALAAPPEALEHAIDADDDEDEEVRNVADEYLTEDDPDPEVQAGLDDPIVDDPSDPEWEFAPPEVTMTPQQRGEALMAHLQGLWDGGARDFATRDLRPLWESTGMKRAWAQKQLKKLIEADVLGYDDDAQRYLMPERPEVG
ncbi:hypothetical protein ACWDR9_07425 [Streptosporangium sandarakinum]|uniref:hypothetical protein n=1 Tax=Streptosporangium sandarakinum TaxID=1260955 RepID=UPI00369B9EC0